MQQHFSLLFVLFISYAIYTKNSGATTQNHENKNSTYMATQRKKLSQIACQTTDDCNVYFQNLECRDKLCQCPDSLILSSDGTKCLEPNHYFGSSCDDNNQCYNALSIGGVCIKNECRCTEGYHYLRGSCQKNRGLRERCTENEQCFASYEYRGLECKDNVCQCKSEYYERFKSGCRRKRNLKESCNINSDCPKNYVCDKMKCLGNSMSGIFLSNKHLPYKSAPDVENKFKCQRGHFGGNGSCLLELGMPCTRDDQCNHISNALCIEEICTCELVTYVPKENNRECLKVARAKIQDIKKSSCKENVQCSVFGPKSFCNGKNCDCTDDTYFSNNDQFCWPVKELGESCVANRDCGKEENHTECKLVEGKKICTCKKGFHQANKKCLADAWNIGDHCEVDLNCLLPHTYCNETTKTCQCQQNYYEEKKKCIGGIGSHCRSSVDCSHLENVVCDSSTEKCLCKENHVADIDNKHCLRGATYGEACNYSKQCKLFLGEEAECIRNNCGCTNRAVYSDDKCIQIKYIGEKCVKQSECIPGNDANSVLCFKGFCTCNFDYTMNESKICVPSKSVVVAKIHYSLLLVISFITFFKF